MLCNRAYNALGWQRIVVQAMRKSGSTCRKSPQKGEFPAISGNRNYMFSWFTRHVAYFLFLTTAAFRLSKGKANRIIYISGRQEIFLSGMFVRLHSSSFLLLIYPFSDSLVCNSVYRASFLFRTEGIFFISLHGQEMERTGKESYVARLIDPYLFLCDRSLPRLW